MFICQIALYQLIASPGPIANDFVRARYLDRAETFPA